MNIILYLIAWNQSSPLFILSHTQLIGPLNHQYNVRTASLAKDLGTTPFCHVIFTWYHMPTGGWLISAVLIQLCSSLHANPNIEQLFFLFNSTFMHFVCS